MDGVPRIDVVILSPAEGPLHPEVERGLSSQVGVSLRIHRVLCRPRPDDPHRWATIVRGRNEARRCGAAPWVMFVDSDVVLPTDGIQSLWRELDRRPNYAAFAADYLGDRERPRPRGHVAMGAMLIRRSSLSHVRFRWAAGRCECQCFCDDLRSLGWGVEYLAGLTARHVSSEAGREPGTADACCAEVACQAPQILVALDRRHLEKFRRQFLGTLRAWGNHELVHVVAYGFYPSEQRRLASMPKVAVHPSPLNGVMAPIRRLRDFQTIAARLPEATPVAYWDAGDVVFQSALEPLWKLARGRHGRILACREPKSHPANRAVSAWTLSIRDPERRRRAYDLLTSRPFLNSGFAAGTAGAMRHYFEAADRALHSVELAGTSDWGDQTALNFYCHSNPSRWCEIEEGWNYCLHDRSRGEVRVTPTGRLASQRGVAIYVAHGNARSERKLALSVPASAGLSVSA